MSNCTDFTLFADFYSDAECMVIVDYFLHQHVWPDNRYQYAGREFILPRLQTWHADPGIRYSYSNNLLETRPWLPILSDIRQKLEVFLGYSFNAVLVNCYRDGEDYVGWHADDEPELGEQAVIASISFGAERWFEMRHKYTDQQHQILLSQGCLLVMHAGFQTDWLHRVPKDKNISQSRINMTFRNVVL